MTTNITVSNLTAFIRNYETVNSVKVWNVYLWAEGMSSFYRYRLATRDGVLGFEGETGERLQSPGTWLSIDKMLIECKQTGEISNYTPVMKHITESEVKQFLLSSERWDYIHELVKNNDPKSGVKIMVAVTMNDQGDVRVGKVEGMFNNENGPRIQIYIGQSGHVISTNQILSVFKIVPCKGIEGLKNF